MKDLPPGDWSDLLVGAWWPSAQATHNAMASSSNRSSTATAYEDYASQLTTVVSGALADQEGATADSANASFNAGTQHALWIAEHNIAKADAYKVAADSLEGLRSELRTVAELGNSTIKQIQSNSAIVEKVLPIAQTVSLANSEAGRISAIWSAKVSAAAESVLALTGDGRSLEQFARDNGLELTQGHPEVKTDSLEQQIINKLDSLSESSSIGGPEKSALTELGNLGPDSPVSFVKGPSPLLQDTATATYPTESAPLYKSTDLPAMVNAVNAGDMPTKTIPAGVNVDQGVTAGVPGSVGGGGGGPAGHPMNAPIASPGGSASGGNSSLPPTTGLSPSTSSAALSPESLAESFNSGMQSGAPMSAGAEALSQGISETAQQAPQNPTPPAPVAPTAPSGGFAYEAPQHFSEPAAPAPAPTETTQQPMYAAPVAAAPAAPVAPMAPPPAAPAGPLPAYGSDLRPTAAAAAPPPPVAAPAPLSAPTSAASGTAASNQPAVVRQAPTAAAQTGVTPAGIAETAMGSAATGAIAGAAAQQSIEQARLDRLLEAVARQEPKLKWAIGDREDGTTVLVTDLASGWIPPHIEIPKGVELLQPQKRRGGLEHLLGETVNHSIWTPGHYLPNAKDVEPVEMTFRARQVPDIEELNWELTQATNWRDGLPRLAHTLTKAGIAGTGVLESEADLLYEHLTAARGNVVRAYPGSVDPTDVGNWQLLAAISGLIAKDKTTLKYHFAWFQALSMATQGGSR